MKTILVLSGGTSTAWNICTAIRKVAGSNISLIVCDTNPAWLVHSSTIADCFIQVSPILSSDYYNKMLSLFELYHVDIIIPLIDYDIQYFPNDNPDLLNLGIIATTPAVETFKALSNKRNLYKTLSQLSIPTPHVFTIEELEDNIEYFVKPIVGFGSRGAYKALGSEIYQLGLEDCIVQELCNEQEITVDIFSHEGETHCVCRERIEVKAGVCTKARVFYDREIERYIQKVAEYIPLPIANCAQFMKSKSGDWLLIDFNLRLGGGSALSAAVNFKVAESAVATWLGLPEKKMLEIPHKDHYVVRHYVEVVTQ